MIAYYLKLTTNDSLDYLVQIFLNDTFYELIKMTTQLRSVSFGFPLSSRVFVGHFPSN